MWIGLLVGFCVIGPVLAWVTGMFNPMGYLGVPPWRVPECTCGRDFAHEQGCLRR